jgi:crotonobetainyl-CoA:carnitine CoA-transferase CaiB-like acyl-CoA transferase
VTHEPRPPQDADLPLHSIRVIDAATLFAGPLIGSLLGDYGADVIKIEHPNGDALRLFGWKKKNVSLWWAVVSRNKRSVTLNLSHPRGRDVVRGLLASADVFIENFRPGTLERWGLDPHELLRDNPRLVVVRATGFGQTGPYAGRAGFGTLAEAMSGFAHINGWPDGPPTLPPLALADSIAALTGAFAAMLALWWRDQPGGKGQVVDLSIYEPMFWVLGPQALAYQQLGLVQSRTGNAAPFTAPRNVYRSKDGQWLALSAATQPIAERVMAIVGRGGLTREPWFADNTGRLAHAEELDAIIGGWIGERTAAEVLDAFAENDAAIAPVMSIAEIVHDPQYLARETITEVEHPVLGPLQMQNVIPRLTRTPGRVRAPGPELGEHNREVLIGELGLDEETLAELSELGVIAVTERP